MKKALSFFTLLVLCFIGFIHNSMILFAMESHLNSDLKNNIEIQHDKNTNQECTDICCAEGSIDQGVTSIKNNFLKKTLETTQKYDFIDINTLGSYWRGNKNLVNKTSPPYYDKKIINYSYHTLIKIIKSNT